MVEAERRAGEAKGPSSQREEGWEKGEKESKRVEKKENPPIAVGWARRQKYRARETKVVWLAPAD